MPPRSPCVGIVEEVSVHKGGVRVVHGCALRSRGVVAGVASASESGTGGSCGGGAKNWWPCVIKVAGARKSEGGREKGDPSSDLAPLCPQ